MIELVEDRLDTVSYTHLDVYKRQPVFCMNDTREEIFSIIMKELFM